MKPVSMYWWRQNISSFSWRFFPHLFWSFRLSAWFLEDFFLLFINVSAFFLSSNKNKFKFKWINNFCSIIYEMEWSEDSFLLKTENKRKNNVTATHWARTFNPLSNFRVYFCKCFCFGFFLFVSLESFTFAC